MSSTFKLVVSQKLLPDEQFLPVDAELILKFLFLVFGDRTKLIWHYDKRGIYSERVLIKYL